MKYIHIVQYVASTVWSILPSKWDELAAVLAYRAAGHIFTEDEIAERIGARSAGAEAPHGSAIAVIPLRGVIAHRMGTMDESSGGMSAERFTRMLRTAVADPSVASILIDVDSPGGTVPGVPEAADAVFEARQSKKVVAIANSTMASAAYWIASQAHEVVAIPSVLEGRIGSIGAFSVHQDISAALEKEGIKTTIFSAGKFKTEGNPFQPLTEEYAAVRQASVDGAHDQFVRTVARGRGVAPADVRGGYGQGRALSAVDAKAAGLIDRIASVEDTLARLASPHARARIGMRAELGDAALEDVPPSIANVDADRARRMRIQ